MNLSQSFWQGVEEFNTEEFYACHDTFEALWIEAPESEKYFYQGILQVAVGCYHLNNLNWRGAVILLGEGIRKLCNYQPHHHGIDIERLLNESSQLLSALQQIEPETIAEFVEMNSVKRQERTSGSTGEPSPADRSRADYISRHRFPRIVLVES